MSDHLLPADLHDPKWFVLFVRSNQEKRIAQRLAQGDVEHYLPCYRSVRQWKDRRVTLEMPLFPGYLFVRLPFSDRAKILTVPNVVSLVGGRNTPSILSDDEIHWIKLGLAHGNALPHTALAIGQRVRIVSGPLTGMRGILMRHQNGSRVVISLDSIARSFLVEVDLAAVEPFDLLPPRYPELGQPQRALV